jgi:hypothetical protein
METFPEGSSCYATDSMLSNINRIGHGKLSRKHAQSIAAWLAWKSRGLITSDLDGVRSHPLSHGRWSAIQASLLMINESPWIDSCLEGPEDGLQVSHAANNQVATCIRAANRTLNQGGEYTVRFPDLSSHRALRGTACQPKKVLVCWRSEHGSPRERSFSIRVASSCEKQVRCCASAAQFGFTGLE